MNVGPNMTCLGYSELFDLLDEVDNAIDSLEKSLATYQKIMGKDHVFTSVILEKLGTCYIRKRNPTEASWGISFTKMDTI